jgi:tetratricopeptide (TPR) repeat protein
MASVERPIAGSSAPDWQRRFRWWRGVFRCALAVVVAETLVVVWGAAYFGLQAWGDRASVAGDWAAAATAYRWAGRVFPVYAVPQAGLGEALLRLGKDKEALAVLRRAKGLPLEYRVVDPFLGDALAAAGRWDEALIYYSSACHRHPFNGAFLCRRGDAHRHSGDRAGAVESFRAAYARDYLCRAALEGSATSLEATGRTQDAAALYRAVQLLQPDSPVAQQALKRLQGNPPAGGEG